MELSVVIPIRNQTLSLDLTLFWFEKILDDRCEVVIVDDGSEEDIKAVANRYPALNIKYIRRDHGGRAAARNTGIENTEGKRILFNDGDRFPAQSDIAKHINAQGVMTGLHMEYYFMRPEKKVDSIKYDFDKIKKSARRIAFPCLVRDYLFDENGQCATNMGWLAFLTGNVSAPKDAIVEAGGFDNGFVSWGVEHFDLGYRIWKQNIPFEYSDTAANYHIAHGREAGFYRDNMLASTEYFQKKYNDLHLVSFADFLFGRISLQQLEREAPKARFERAPWLDAHPDNVFFSGLKSDILAAPSGKE